MPWAAAPWSSRRSATRRAAPACYASWPAALQHVIGVSAVDQQLAWARFSNTDPVFNDIAAPGVGIITTVPRSLAPTGSSLDAPPGHDGRHRRHGARDVVRRAARERRRGRAPGAPPRAHAEPGRVDPRAHGPPARRRRRRRPRSASPASGCSTSRPPSSSPTARPRRCRRPTPTSPTTWPGGADRSRRRPGTTDAIADFGDDRRDVYTRLRAQRRRRCGCAPSGCRSAATSASTSRSSRPGRQHLAGPRDAGARAHARGPNSASTLRHVRNRTGPNGSYLVQVTARRGWGAYRLRWTRVDGYVAPLGSGAEQLVGRHVAQDARGLADHDGARRHVAQHDRARPDEGVLADLDARQQDRRAADARAAPDRSRPS